MIQFTLSLAGIPVGVTATCSSTKRFCRDYLIDTEPLFTVSVTQTDIDAERARAQKQDALAGIRHREYSDRYLETLALYRAIAIPLLDYDTIVFHGSAISVGGRACLFTAPSGTGKTTHSKLWVEEIPGAYILNGDKPLLRVVRPGVQTTDLVKRGYDRYSMEGKEGEYTVLACGTPWQGKEGYGCNEILPLEAICILGRAKENTIREVGFKDAVPALIGQTYRPDQAELVMKTLSVIRSLGKVRMYRFDCNMKKEAAWVSYNRIFGERIMR